jgi:uncharacterized protein (TIGR00255 family)
MALQSMTGYGRAEESAASYSINVELKSVNNRFLDFQCRVPRELLHLEPLLRRELGSFISRGSVTCHVNYETHGAAATQVSLNEPLFQAYTTLMQRMTRDLGPQAQANLADLLKIPEMVIQSQSSPVETPEAATEKILPVFRKACTELVRMREREGEDLARELEKRVQAIYPALDKVQVLAPQRQAEYVAKMRERIRELLDGQPMAEDRVLTEIGIMAERLDVAEELVRLRAHLGHFLETLLAPSPGKKLGFLQQEMHREVNTLSNKSQYYDIQQICIGWKEDLEIIREQLQNVE